MVNTKSRSLSSLVILGLIAFVCTNVSVFAQSDAAVDPFAGDDQLVQEIPELQAITFEGTKTTRPEQLIGVISSRESQASFTRSLAFYYYENLKANPATPIAAMNTLTKVQQDLRDELRYFNEDMVRNDSVSLLTYLHQNGFHEASVQWRFGYVKETRANTLTFIIDEGQRAVIDTLVYVGLESVDPEVLKIVDEQRLFRSGDPYSEAALEVEFRSVVTALQDNGYYRATYEQPSVMTSGDAFHNDVIVKFVPGPRVKVRAVVFEENPNGYPTVHETTRRRQLEFKEGQWFSRRKLNLSRSNLMELGVFDVVSIDTVSAAFMDSTGMPLSDSNVAIRVFTKNAKVYDVGANLLMFQTAVDNYLNVGAGITAQYNNLFGGAQVATVQLEYILQDISRFFQGQPLESEALARVILAWPNIARVDGLRVGLRTNVYYSLRLLVNPFRLESFGFGGTAPVNLHSHTFFNGFDVNLSFERQVPRNFRDALDSALIEANSPEDSAYVISTFNQFVILDQYLENTNSFFTGIYFGGNIRGEHRDSPLNPTRGTFTSISMEVGALASQFVKAQILHTTVIPVIPTLTLATKVKAGHIQLLDFERGSLVDTNTYVPLERQFFAGGAASIRSYPSRLLHDPNSGVIDIEDDNNQRVLANVIGSGSLLELGFEARFGFLRPRGLDDLWANIIEKSGVTLFTDIGNAFNRFTPDLYGAMQLQDLVIGSAVAVGIGYRYKTPVGPFRIDYATSLYDPLRSNGQFAWNRQNAMAFSNWQLSIGLGHAF